MNSGLVFVDIDTQYDFIMPEGRLYVPHAEKRIPNFKRLTETAIRHHIPLISSVDAHRPDDPEFKHFPPHCLTGTPGQKKIIETLGSRPLIGRNAEAAWKAMESYEAGQIILEKRKFDLFSNPIAAPLFLKLKGDRFVVYGVATDYCVKAAALGLLEFGNPVFLVEDAVAGITPEGSAAAIEELLAQGVQLQTTEEILAKMQPSRSAACG